MVRTPITDQESRQNHGASEQPSHTIVTHACSPFVFYPCAAQAAPCVMAATALSHAWLTAGGTTARGEAAASGIVAGSLKAQAVLTNGRIYGAAAFAPVLQYRALKGERPTIGWLGCVLTSFQHAQVTHILKGGNMTLALIKEQRDRVESDMLGALDGIKAAAELFDKNAKLEIAIMQENLAQFKNDCQRVINDIREHTDRIRRGIL